MKTWIRTYTKQHFSFASAASDRDGVVSSLAREIGSHNVKARIRRRPAGHFDVIVSRREPLLAEATAFEKVSPPVRSTRGSTLRARSSTALLALAVASMTGGN